MADRALIIAEVGSTHDGEPGKMYRLVDEAARASAAVVKFQWCSSAQRLAEQRRAPDYEAAYRLIEFGRGLLDDLREYCRARGILFGCSVYLPEDIHDVASRVDIVKVASFEAGDREFVRRVGHICSALRKPLVISTGMMSEMQILHLDDMLRECASAILSYLLHCVSSYPCPTDQATIGVLRVLAETYTLLPRLGYSDHTMSLIAGAVAVAAGARAVEKHIRLPETSPENADAAFGALLPGDFATYVRHVREAEELFGDSAAGKKPQPAEEAMMRYRSQGSRS